MNGQRAGQIRRRDDGVAGQRGGQIKLSARGDDVAKVKRPDLALQDGGVSDQVETAGRVHAAHCGAGAPQGRVDVFGRDPAGRDIAASTPAEIAVAVLAQIVQALRSRGPAGQAGRSVA